MIWFLTCVTVGSQSRFFSTKPFQINLLQWQKREKGERHNWREMKEKLPLRIFTGQELFYFIDGSADHNSFLLVFKKLACLENTIAEITWVWKIKKSLVAEKNRLFRFA